MTLFLVTNSGLVKQYLFSILHSSNNGNNNPVVIAISTNDGLAGSAENIGKLLNRNNYFFVPFRQDNPITKPRSLVFDPKYIIPTLEKALEKEQVQPILI